MPAFELVKLPDANQLARAAAADWLKELQVSQTPGTVYSVALAGGRIAERFLAATADMAEAQRQLLEPVHFFWSDERCVPPTDPESNYYLAHKSLLLPLGISESQIHRIHGEEPPESAVANAAAELCRLAPRNQQDQPVLDLVFLGMGEDGHVASLFPGESEQTMSSPAVYRVVLASKPPPRRITLGYPALTAARQVWVLASGAGKERALRESLAPHGRTPLARVLKSREATRIFTDIPS